MVTRSIPILVTTAATALSIVGLTGCSATTETAACDPTPSGAASDAVTVEGDLGGVLTVTADYPLEVESTQRTELIAGEGEPVVDGMTVEFQYLVLNGATGETIEDSHDYYADENVAFDYVSDTLMAGFEAALHCATAGSRVVTVITPEDGLGVDGDEDLGVEAGQSLVLVADVLSVTATAEIEESPVDLPTPEAWTTDVPEVDMSGDVPVVTIPDAAAPTALEVAVIDEGDGDVVPNPATVTVDYYGVSWETGEVFDESFSSSPASFELSGVIEGFAAAIVGQQVGSTVLVTIPPEYGYGTDTSVSDLAGQTLVFLTTIESYE